MSISQSVEVSEKKPPSRRLLLWSCYVIAIAAITWLIVDGYSYYSTPYIERPHHPDYRVFRPAGSRGLLYGYLGAAMMIVMLIYSLRKRFRFLEGLSSLQSMLHFHIFLGIMGPLFIVLHTSFKVQGLVAVSFWSMVAVAASGFLGRYLYQQIPRNIIGSELTLQELEKIKADKTTQLKLRFQLDDRAVDKLENVTTRFASGFSGGSAKAVLLLLTDDLFRFLARRRFMRDVMRAVPLPRRELREFTRLAFERALLLRRVNLLSQIQQIFHYWHVIHKPFAIIMYLIMLVHIGVAIWTGYGWAW
ncbi:MAG: hypothetical protein IPH75_13060 [bacterium]|nr:hypothetical protein [bacterium]